MFVTAGIIDTAIEFRAIYMLTGDLQKAATCHDHDVILLNSNNGKKNRTRVPRLESHFHSGKDQLLKVY